MDPVRPSVPDAVNECYNAGIRVCMITGDYPLTARKIGQQIGLRSPENIITGSELQKMTDKELRERIKSVTFLPVLCQSRNCESWTRSKQTAK
jgi:Ca2+-transporting ATPase